MAYALLTIFRQGSLRGTSGRSFAEVLRSILRRWILPMRLRASLRADSLKARGLAGSSFACGTQANEQILWVDGALHLPAAMRTS